MVVEDPMAVAVISEVQTPIELVAEMVASSQVPFEHVSEETLVAFVDGQMAEYEVSFEWYEYERLLHIVYGFNYLVERKRLPQLHELIRRLNVPILLGHFEHNAKNKMILWRCTLPCPEEHTLSQHQVQEVLNFGHTTCEERMMSFLMVAKGISAAKAIRTNIIETQGSA